MRLAIDIGGTFTDFVLVGEDRVLHSAKELTDYEDTALRMVQGAERLLAQRDAVLSDVSDVIHGTTLASNLVLQRKGPATALITTRGFRDLLLVQRQRRHHLYDLAVGKAEPLVPRRLVFEVDERMDASGTPLRKVEESSVRDQIAAALRAEGVEAVAICLLNSYANPIHEQVIAQIIATELPNVSISQSSEISRRYREYERASTAVMNAYVTPVVQGYIARLAKVLDERGFQGNLYMMQSNGGVATLQMVAEAPIRLIESGPAAGALMAAKYGADSGASHSVALDMGGTTAKVSLSAQGKLSMVDEFEVDRVSLRAGSGLPINVAAVDLIEIGAGGGSIASVRMNLLAVGPQSAGSDPGPACYGQGGHEATVTDANLVLGYLNPEYFAGGQIKLDVDRARAAIKEHVADHLGLTVELAAWGIHEVATAQMSAAIRVTAIERGIDPRLSSLIAFGGAGPAHAIRIARDLGIATVILPALAGVGSAVGLLASPIQLEFTRTMIIRLEEDAIPTINQIYASLEADALSRLQASVPIGEDQRNVDFERSMDLRYVGQGYQVTVEMPSDLGVDWTLADIRGSFERAYRNLYGYSEGKDAEIEGVDWRVVARVRGVGDRDIATEARAASPMTSLMSEPKDVRSCFFPESDGFIDCPIYERATLSTETAIAGPAIIEEEGTTTVLLPEAILHSDASGQLVASVNQLGSTA